MPRCSWFLTGKSCRDRWLNQLVIIPPSELRWPFPAQANVLVTSSNYVLLVSHCFKEFTLGKEWTSSPFKVVTYTTIKKGSTSQDQIWLKLATNGPTSSSYKGRKSKCSTLSYLDWVLFCWSVEFNRTTVSVMVAHKVSAKLLLEV